MEKWKASLYRAALALQPRPAWLRAGAQLFRAQGNIPARQAEGIRRALQAHCAVGAAVALFDDAAVTGTLAYGAARFENGRPVPVTPDTVFRAASVSKHVTALAVMRLAQAGQIDLDADVDEYLPCSLRHPAAPELPVTLRRLLSHTAGLQDGASYIAACRDNPPLSALFPGDCFAPAPDRFVYSNLGAGIAACVLEGMLGQDFEAIMQRALFEPLGIAATFYPQKAGENMADAFRVLPAQAAPTLNNALRRARPLSAPAPDPARHYLLAQGNLYISAPALARLGREAMQPRYADMRQGIAPFGARAYSLTEGLGTFIVQDAAVCPQTLYGHQGLAYGAMHGLFYDPQSRRGFALLTSGASEARDGVLSDLNKAIMRQVFTDD